MAEITFSLTSSSEVLDSPFTVSDSLITINITNYEEDTLSELGIYISPATSVGDVDFPADYPPETDYEDLLTWGSRTASGESLAGGLWLSTTGVDGPWSGYITRQKGSKFNNRILLPSLEGGDTLEISIRFETPEDEPARRFFVDLKVD